MRTTVQVSRSQQTEQLLIAATYILSTGDERVNGKADDVIR